MIAWRTRCCSSMSALPAAPRRSPLDELSDRELEVLRLIGEGHSTRQIAENLHISVKTVESYQGHLKEKLGLQEFARTFPVRHAIRASRESRRLTEVT